MSGVKFGVTQDKFVREGITESSTKLSHIHTITQKHKLIHKKLFKNGTQRTKKKGANKIQSNPKMRKTKNEKKLNKCQWFEDAIIETKRI